MSVSKLKRTLWVFNEFVTSYPKGISITELSEKWPNSSMNDEKEPKIPERTFHRIRRAVESTFNIEIECIKGAEPRYRVSSEYLEPGDNSLLTLLLNKATKDNEESKSAEENDQSKSVKEILGLIMSGSDVPEDDMKSIKDIHKKLNIVSHEKGLELIDSVKEGKIQGADRSARDEDYGGYVCIWNDEDYHRTDLWLSIGIRQQKVYFYVVTSVQDPEYREKVAELLELDNGEKYQRGYWWYEPADKSLFQLDYNTLFPDMNEVKRRVELLISRIAQLPKEIQLPKE